MRGLKGRVALVTGAAGGIGQAVCARFVEEGATVVACDVNASTLKELSEATFGTGRLPRPPSLPAGR